MVKAYGSLGVQPVNRVGGLWYKSKGEQEFTSGQNCFDSTRGEAALDSSGSAVGEEVGPCLRERKVGGKVNKLDEGLGIFGDSGGGPG